MLDRERLHAIQWNELSDAYGPADDVPKWIEALYGTEDEANAANYELFGSITHQGSRYEATVAAMPFLIDVVVDDSATESARVTTLHLVRFAAMGSMGRRYDWSAQRDEQTSPAAKDCWQLAVDRWKDLEQLLDEESAELVGYVLELLCWTGNTSDSVLRSIRGLLRSNDAIQRSWGFAASTILGVEPDLDLMQVPEGRDRFAWAGAALRFLGDECPSIAIDELCAGLLGERSDLEGPFVWGDAVEQICAGVARSVPKSLESYFSTKLLDVIAVDSYVALELYLQLWLGEPNLNKRKPGPFSTGQIDALRSLERAVTAFDNQNRQRDHALPDFRGYAIPGKPSRFREWVETL